MYKSLPKACHVPININIDVRVISINIVYEITLTSISMLMRISLIQY